MFPQLCSKTTTPQTFRGRQYKSTYVVRMCPADVHINDDIFRKCLSCFDGSPAPTCRRPSSTQLTLIVLPACRIVSPDGVTKNRGGGTCGKGWCNLQWEVTCSVLEEPSESVWNKFGILFNSIYI